MGGIFKNNYYFWEVIKIETRITMKQFSFKALFAVALVALTLTTAPTVSAKEKKEKKTSSYAKNQQTYTTNISTEFGLGVGARYNWLYVQPLSNVFTADISNHYSYGAALQFRLNLGKTFGIQPEISYARTTLKINDATNKFSTKATSDIVQIPMLLSFRAAMFRFNFGPVFTLMDNLTYQLADPNDEMSIKKMPLGKLFPSVTYAAGISVKFAKCLMLDVRYADQFTKIASENEYLWTLDKTKQSEAQRFRTHTRSVQLRFGLLF